MDEVNSGSVVLHPKYGTGAVEVNKGLTVLVRFEHGYEECLAEELSTKKGLLQVIEGGEHQPVQRVACRALALALRSINDSWGVFSRSKISLLPHQLWVCHRALRQWPTYHLIADDVGLGKTVEAGLILWPLLAKKTVRRILVLTPAPLVEQWQQRLRQMFDIRLTAYVPQADTPRSDYWNTHNQVVASLPTLRKDVNGRHQRMLEAEDWDLLIIDEAHHLNAIEDSGATQGYRFVEKLIEHNKFVSRLFFSGTPHRGKDYGFFALMRLLRPDLFDLDSRTIDEMRESVGKVLIRNNKQNVTDMAGNKLFKPVNVISRTYEYSEAEEAFYSQLTNFILSGQAYASSLNSRDQRAVMLVLTAMQKLASSSVSAIRRAIYGRLARHKQIKERLIEIQKLQDALSDKAQELQGEEMAPELTDEWQDLEEEFAAASVKVQLMNDELPRLKVLLEFADQVHLETRIQKIIDILNDEFQGRTVVFFTEYKATQALLMSELHKHFGDKTVSFINGENRLENVLDASGKSMTCTMDRYTAADMFNRGKVRFIISTEAGGEGIDLQDRCHSMIHVDLPWNPMRLHQRVGRLNRYGQKHQVDVITLRNPDTVESRIWGLLNEKIENIMRAIGGAMDEPEDLMQLILGMSDSRIFNELFTASLVKKPEEIESKWFDAKTQTMGGRAVIEVVRDLVGRAEKFDCKDLDDVPRLDLKDLQPFFEGMLALNSRRPKCSGEEMSFKTPEKWLTEIAIKRAYKNLVFNRETARENKALDVIGFGHPLFGKAIDQALDFGAYYARVDELDGTLVVFNVRDRVTGSESTVRIATVGVLANQEGRFELLKDEVLVHTLNRILRMKGGEVEGGTSLDNSESLAGATDFLRQNIGELGLPFSLPEAEAAVLIEGKGSESGLN
ncbi:DEAD/DEAH box helicase [Sansalvadorimonas verongulae]|uniref:DEAD/DEAH box helicase n=1 Tax=Sansalvadorimonas verongulae TaxID=2172824 RepID=UPI0012BBB2D5|nr:SNF2-related protein [Sansalvadorimonas verongulae]MTI13159.1 DEAD/DEAH box helicase [Sansalvadorimonas verongulae]